MRILPLPTLKTALALILLVVLAAAGYGAWYALSPLSVSKLPVEVEVPLGTGFRAAVDQLEHAGIAIHRREFELLARALGQDRDIKAGSYEIAVPLTPVELLDKLTRGDVAQAEVRLIEGWTFAQFRAALNASADLRHDSAELEDARILVQLDVPEEQPEGLFFPDTYLFARGSSDMAVLRRAHLPLDSHLQAEWEAPKAGRPFRTPHRARPMAPLAVKETALSVPAAIAPRALV